MAYFLGKLSYRNFELQDKCLVVFWKRQSLSYCISGGHGQCSQRRINLTDNHQIPSFLRDRHLGSFSPAPNPSPPPYVGLTLIVSNGNLIPPVASHIGAPILPTRPSPSPTTRTSSPTQPPLPLLLSTHGLIEGQGRVQWAFALLNSLSKGRG